MRMRLLCVSSIVYSSIALAAQAAAPSSQLASRIDWAKAHKDLQECARIAEAYEESWAAGDRFTYMSGMVRLLNALSTYAVTVRPTPFARIVWAARELPDFSPRDSRELAPAGRA